MKGVESADIQVREEMGSVQVWWRLEAKLCSLLGFGRVHCLDWVSLQGFEAEYGSFEHVCVPEVQGRPHNQCPKALSSTCLGSDFWLWQETYGRFWISSGYGWRVVYGVEIDAKKVVIILKITG